MKVSVGDRIVNRGRGLGQPDRHGKVLEVRGAYGGAPYGRHSGEVGGGDG